MFVTVKEMQDIQEEEDEEEAEEEVEGLTCLKSCHTSLCFFNREHRHNELILLRSRRVVSASLKEVEMAGEPRSSQRCLTRL